MASKCMVSVARLTVALIALSLPHVAEGYIMFVEGKECLMQHIEAGDSITGSFVVTDVDSAWGEDHAGIDFWIDGPNNYKLYSVRNKAEDQFQIRAVHSGDYKFCMENVEHMAASVDLSFHIGHHTPVKLEHAAKDEHFDEMQDKISQLEEGIWEITEQLEYYKARDIRRKKTNVSTSRRLIWYTVLETLVLMGACGVQIYVLRRLFEKRSMRFGA